MDYFILEVDEAYVSPALTLNIKTLSADGELPESALFSVSDHMQLVFTDLIMHPYFMVSKAMRKVIESYEPGLRFKRVLLFHQKRRYCQAYYFPFLEEVSALTENSHLNLDRSIIYHAEVNGNKLSGKALVRLSGVNTTCILIRLDLIESLLRRKMVGIGLREIETVYSVS